MLLDVKLQCEFCRQMIKIWRLSISFGIRYTLLYPREEVSEFFEKMDRDFDGRLSFGEFLGEETPLEKVFKNMDKDGDGTITKEVGVYFLVFYLIIFFLGVFKDLQTPDPPTGDNYKSNRNL